MADTTFSPTTSDVRRVSVAGIAKEHLFWVALVCAYLPLVLMHFHSLWQRTHYQFFPFLLVAVAFLLWRRWPKWEESEFIPASRTAKRLLVFSMLLLTAAVILFSPYLGFIAALLMVGGVLAHFAGRGFRTELFSSWILLWLLVPPPFRGDDRLITWLQSFTSEGASIVLDRLGVLHLLAGNVIDLPGRSLFVEEACSGIQSLFALMSCAAILVVFSRRRAIPAVLLVASTVFWAGLFNIVRITTVVYALARWDIDLSSGWQHELLGVVVFILAMLMLFSTDRFLWVLGAWNRPVWSFVIQVLKRMRKQRSGDEDAYQDEYSRSQASSDTGNGNQMLSEFSWRLFVVVGICVCLFVLQIAILVASRSSTTRISQITAQLKESTFPAEQQGWELINYKTYERELESEFGQFSNTWTYQAPMCPVEVSFDYPFIGWHEVTSCYISQGWDVVRRSAPDGNAAADPVVEVELSKPTGEHAFLVFGAFDEFGRPVQPPASSTNFWLRLQGRIVHNPVFELMRQSEVAVPDTAAITYQMQAFLVTEFKLSSEQRRQARTQFLSFKDRMRQQWDQQPENGP